VNKDIGKSVSSDDKGKKELIKWEIEFEKIVSHAIGECYIEVRIILSKLYHRNLIYS